MIFSTPSDLGNRHSTLPWSVVPSSTARVGRNSQTHLSCIGGSSRRGGSLSNATSALSSRPYFRTRVTTPSPAWEGRFGDGFGDTFSDLVTLRSLCCKLDQGRKYPSFVCEACLLPAHGLQVKSMRLISCRYFSESEKLQMVIHWTSKLGFSMEPASVSALCRLFALRKHCTC